MGNNFSLIILAATVFSLVRLPSVVSTAVAFSRGEKAAKEKNYITAANEYKKVAEKYSNSTQILAKLFLAQYYNLQMTRPMTPLRLYRKGRRRYRTGRESKWNITKIKTCYYPQSNSFYTLLLEYYDDTKTLVEAVSEYLSIYPMMFAQPITLQTKKLNLKSMMKLKSLQMTSCKIWRFLFRSPSSCWNILWKGRL